MASITKYKDGYRAQVSVKGARDSAVFRTQREAKAWAAAKELELRKASSRPEGEKHTLGEAMTRYAGEVSPTKRGERWEKIRIRAMLDDAHLPTSSPIGRVTPDDLGQWRNERSKQVAPATVLREIALLSVILETARREWRWIASNPIKDIRKPTKPDHRDVLLTREQIKGVLRALGYRRGPCLNVSHAVALAFMVALRTGMRAGELCGLTWDRINDDYCILPVTKTKPREVPLTPKAMRLIQSMRGFDPKLVFGVKAQTLDALFRRARERAGLSGFTFHDSRHYAATQLAQRVHILDLCKAFGWSNINQAQVYYNPSASDIAGRMSNPVRQ
ncbi:MAG TPA: site-specific integrase [Rhodocyclaceae bacterium]|nr:site-specific integrase [Rhodocyclaceae bacterium]